MSNYNPSQSSSDGQDSNSVPAYQPYQPSEPQPYQPSADGWGQQSQEQVSYAPNPASSAPSYAGQGQAAPGYNPNAYASGYSGYSSPAGGSYQPSASNGGTNVLAILSLVSSIVGFLFLWFIGPIAGIVLAKFAKKQIAETGEQGEGLATAGWWTGWVGLALQVLFILGWIALFVLAIAAGGSSYNY